jgi:hypothetical protein
MLLPALYMTESGLVPEGIEGTGASTANANSSAFVTGVYGSDAASVVTVALVLVGSNFTQVSASSEGDIQSEATAPMTFQVEVDGAVVAQSTVTGFRTIPASIQSNALIAFEVAPSVIYYVEAESLAHLISTVDFLNEYFDGYAYNLNTEAPSFYEQFKFNSFAQVGRDYYGMNEDGIHILTGDTDDGEDINAVMTTGLTDFDDSTLKTVPVIYASARSHKEMLLTARVDNYPDYSYTFIGKPAELAPVRVKLGRGLKGLNWQLELSNKDGAFIEIDALDVPTVSTSRKV